MTEGSNVSDVWASPLDAPFDVLDDLLADEIFVLVSLAAAFATADCDFCIRALSVVVRLYYYQRAVHTVFPAPATVCELG